ncbi:unnamed protein product [Penicillium pancosmium]
MKPPVESIIVVDPNASTLDPQSHVKEGLIKPMLQANAIVLNTMIAQRDILFLGSRESKLLDVDIKSIGRKPWSRVARYREAKFAMASGQAAAERSDPDPAQVEQNEPRIILTAKDEKGK